MRVTSGVFLALLFSFPLVVTLKVPGVVAEPSGEGWTQTYGGTDNDYSSSVVQTTDGGYALAGYTESFGAGGSDFWLVKTNSAGNMEWSRTYGGTEDDFAYSMVQTGDEGYALAGYTSSFGCSEVVAAKFWLVKVDSSGNMQWSGTYGLGDWNVACSVVEASDGGFVLAGTVSYPGAAEAWLFKVDSNGNEVWSRQYSGGFGRNIPLCLVRTVDGGYALLGVGGWTDIESTWLFKVDSDGNEDWSRTYEGWEAAGDVVQTSDGGYALVGDTSYYGVGLGDMWLVKIDANGMVQWNVTYGGTDTDHAYSMVQTVDGGCALVGSTESYGSGGVDMWLVKIDMDGTAQWNVTCGGTNDDSAESVVQTRDGGYAVAGHTFSYGAGGSDAWLVKTTASGVIAEFPLGIVSAALVVTVTLTVALMKKLRVSFPNTSELLSMKMSRRVSETTFRL